MARVRTEHSVPGSVPARIAGLGTLATLRVFLRSGRPTKTSGRGLPSNGHLKGPRMLTPR